MKEDILQSHHGYQLATMLYMERYRPPVKAPDIPPDGWLNSFEPITQEGRQGTVTLVDFFDYTCINCIRTLPYLRAWHERYESLGLRILGIHTPEFSFAHHADHVEAGIHRLGVNWPVFLDNDQSLWTAFATRYWPTLYLLDGQGKIRSRHVGEGNYAEIESCMQAMLQELLPEKEMPAVLPPLHPEDTPGAFCIPTSPEIQIGSVNQINLVHSEPISYRIPEDLEENRIYPGGSWRVTRDGMTLTGTTGEIALRYKAARVFAILSPFPDDRDRLPSNNEPLYIQVLQDGQPLSHDCFGEDIQADGTNAQFRVNAPRLFRLIENPEVETHDLKLSINQPGLTFYAFSFGSCVSDGPETSLLKE